MNKNKEFQEMSLVDELKKHEMSGENNGFRGRGVRLFLSQKDEIQEAISQGWTYKKIHNVLQSQEKMPVVYRVFCKYIYQYITSKKHNSKSEPNLKSNRNSRSQKTQRFHNKKPDKSLMEPAEEKHEKLRKLAESNKTEKVGNEAFLELDINEDEFFAPAEKEPLRKSPDSEPAFTYSSNFKENQKLA